MSLLPPDDVRRRIDERARALRQAQGLTQAALAAVTGISTSTIKRFESGGHVAFDVVVQVGFALGVETSLLEAFPPENEQTFDALTKVARKRQRVRMRSQS